MAAARRTARERERESARPIIAVVAPGLLSTRSACVFVYKWARVCVCCVLCLYVYGYQRRYGEAHTRRAPAHPRRALTCLSRAVHTHTPSVYRDHLSVCLRAQTRPACAHHIDGCARAGSHIRRRDLPTLYTLGSLLYTVCVCVFANRSK